MLSSATEPAKFSAGILSAYIICVILYSAVFVLTYSYYFNNRAKLYRKMKINISSIILIAFMFVMFLTLAIMVSIQHTYFKNNVYMLPMT
ncbi:hypothetical protein FACS1894166_05790 [Bacilli bacterium]|nr:hypothetical protein FACS1894166_05790 [Bacilli bacterium]